MIAAIYLLAYMLSEKSQTILAIILIVIIGIFTIFVLYLLLFHSFLALFNMTTWECLSWTKISYLKDWPRHLGSPFNIGIPTNLKLYFLYNLSQENYFVWKMPKRRPDI
jgi:palmitoyltransferase